LARIPVDATPDVKESFRQLWEEMDKLRATTVDFHGVRLSSVGYPVQPTDAATRGYADDRFDSLDVRIKKLGG